ncbi:MAG TPA: FkbM family methyltransferase [Stellaceae bacterium]|nr:FkbM family methyltransferase [Stellaceae bacterium]
MSKNGIPAAGTGVMAALRRSYGIARSAAIYRARPWRRGRALALYRPFIASGALAFDIGAHLGDRTRYFRALGARVVAVEPQPELAARLQRAFRGDSGVSVLCTALGAAQGHALLHRDPMNPTLATLSKTWTRALTASAAFRSVRWRETRSVPVTTLDALISRFGVPAFTKIDVEGFEAEVVGGLNHRVAALSFEYVTVSLEPALQTLDRLRSLGRYEYNRSEGESLRLIHRRWVDFSAITREIEGLSRDPGSGDIYARLRDDA